MPGDAYRYASAGGVRGLRSPYAISITPTAITLNTVAINALIVSSAAGRCTKDDAIGASRFSSMIVRINKLVTAGLTSSGVSHRHRRYNDALASRILIVEDDPDIA